MTRMHIKCTVSKTGNLYTKNPSNKSRAETKNKFINFASFVKKLLVSFSIKIADTNTQKENERFPKVRAMILVSMETTRYRRCCGISQSKHEVGYSLDAREDFSTAAG
ncbi:hypothetical protein TNIN_312531 [Trichonephila inaurata madagascariensis]|uniref:Uncharacterized protein n=1 Tax=Trichonephila inaurata madagascariensis TaxID=2747483 RepID=A0A8X6XFR2_9ARAC|nr:hypothetical protein TNIN_312531 [Trichonephila inaurata madagascariensis]